MNRLFLSIAAAAVAVSASAAASDFVGMPVAGAPRAAMVGEDATGAFVYNPASKHETSYSFKAESAPAGAVVSLAIELPEGYRQLFAGNTVTSVSLVSPTNNSDRNTMTAATLCMSNALDAEPFFTKEVTLSGTGNAINKFDVDPYVIKADERLFIYYSMTIGGSCHYIPTDIDINKVAPSPDVFPNSCLLKVNDGNWASYADQLGSIYMNVNIATDRTYANGAVVSDVEVPDVVAIGGNGTAFVYVKNVLGGNVKDVELTYTIDGETKTFTGNLQGTGSTDGAAYNGKGYVALSIAPTKASLDATVDVKLSKVNGQDNAVAGVAGFTAEKTFEVVVTDPETSFERYSVIEEGTGTWCGYCPAGIVMMENLREQEPDMIRIAVHNGDRMALDNYQDFISTYTPGLPGSIVNRYYPVAPTYGDATALARSVAADAAKGRSPFKVELDAVNNDEKVQVELVATVTPALGYDNSDDRFQLSIVIVEDGIGPYNQSNYFAGGMAGVMDGWELKGRTVSTIYDDVARRLIGYPGIENSLQGEMKAGEPMTYTTTTTARGFKGTAARIVAMLVDTKTGFILNACQIPYVPAGIESIEAEADANAPVEYFNLQGIRVSNPVSGQIYITRQGKTVSKILYR